MICVLTTKDGKVNWCESHAMYHNGHYRDYALDPSDKGESFRNLWDRQRDGIHRDVQIVGITQRVANYIASLAEHIANGSKLVPLQIRNDRWNTCEPCEYRNHKQNACSLCGCPLNAHNVLGDKLSWEVSKCPDNRWTRYGSACHLLCHIWPRKVSFGTWQRNLDQLKQRWGLFTGKKIIAVATSVDSHSFEAVQSYMDGYDCEWIQVDNDPDLREVKTFLPLFERIQGLSGYTFYCQGKGVTKPINHGVCIHQWTSTMYEILLDYWPLVEKQLRIHPVVGTFKKSVNGAFGGSSSSWHFSGSFYWLNNAELWKRNWRAIERVWFGIETYPSMIYSREEAACLFFCRDKQFNLYSLPFWQRSVERELALWRSENVRYHSAIGLQMAGLNHSAVNS